MSAVLNADPGSAKLMERQIDFIPRTMTLKASGVGLRADGLWALRGRGAGAGVAGPRTTSRRRC